MATTSTSVFGNLACLSLFVYSNRTVLVLQTLLFFIFPNSALPNWGCGLSKDAAYTRTFTVSLSNALAVKLKLSCQWWMWVTWSFWIKKPSTFVRANESIDTHSSAKTIRLIIMYLEVLQWLCISQWISLCDSYRTVRKNTKLQHVISIPVLLMLQNK